MKRVAKVGSVVRSNSQHTFPSRRVILASVFALALLLPGTALAQTGGISGTVTDAATSAGLGSVTIGVYSWNGANVAVTSTAAGGNYTVSTLPAGIYFVRTFASSTYVDEAWDNVSCENCPITTTAPIRVNAGATTPNINLALSQTGPAGTGTVTGTVTNAVTTAAIANVQVGVYQISGTSVLGVSFPLTNASGVYSAAGLTPGTYVARTFVDSTSPFMDEGYLNQSCSPSCNLTALTAFVVNDGATTTNINFTLALGGGIAGTVTDAVTLAGIPNTWIDIYSSTGSYVKSGFTNASGVYSALGLAPGSYFGRTFTSTQTYIEELYNDIPCAPSCTITSGTPIAVSGTATTNNINFALSPGGAIAGTVTDAGTGNPLQSVSVQVYTSSGSFIRLASTNAMGAYTVSGLPPGTYFARTATSSNVNNQDELYNNIPCTPTCTITSGTPISVIGTSTTNGISFVLPVGATISGTVTDARTGAPGVSITVQMFTAAGVSVKSGFTNSSGVYSVTGLPTGSYYARTGLGSAYVSELYPNINCPHNSCPVTWGVPISVTAGLSQGGINFPLLPTGAADLAIDFGGPGLWMLSADASVRLIHGLSPVATVTGDFDGNGRDDLVVNFGGGVGVWIWMNQTSWTFLHGSSPAQMLTGDFDNNGRDDFVASFTGAGIWRWSDGSWVAVHGSTPNRMAVGRVDSNPVDDLVVDFPGAGIWTLFNNSAWGQLHASSSLALYTADLNGNGRDEVLVSFAGAGLWALRDGATWYQIHATNPVRVALGHLDTSTREDLVIDFGGAGVWTYRNDVTWAQLHTSTTQGIVVVDRTASLSDEIIIDFGASGIWQYSNAGIWSQLHTLNPEDISHGRLR